MSDLQALGLLACGMVIASSVYRAIRLGRFGPVARQGDALAFWGVLSVMSAAVFATIGLAAASQIGLKWP